MANPTLTSAFAPSFRWTASGGNDLVLVTNGDTHNVTVPTTEARILLGRQGLSATTAADAEPVPEFLWHVAARINATIAADMGTETVTLALGADGLAVMSIDSGTFNITPSSYAVMSLLGFTQGATTGVSTLTATRPPRYLALAHAWHGGAGWVPTIPFAGDLSQSGRAWGTRGANPGATWNGTVDLVPSSADYLAATFPSSSVTPLFPSETNALLSTLGSHTDRWSWADLAAAGCNARWAFALGTFQDVVSSTSAVFDHGAIDPDSLRALAVSLLREDYLSIVRFPLRLYRRADVPRSTRL